MHGYIHTYIHTYTCQIHRVGLAQSVACPPLAR